MFGIDGIGIIVYATALFLFSKFGWKPPATALFAGIMPLAALKLQQYVPLLVLERPMNFSLSPNEMLISIAQTLVAYLVFTLLGKTDDNLAVWFTIATVGGVMGYIVVPSLLQLAA